MTICDVPNDKCEWLARLIQQRLGLHQVGRPEALAEPAVNGSQQLVGIADLALVAPGPCDHDRQARLDVIEAIAVRNFADAAYAGDESDAFPAKGRAAAKCWI